MQKEVDSPHTSLQCNAEIGIASIGILQLSVEFLKSADILLKSYILNISKLDLWLLLSSIFLGEQLFHSKQHNSQ